MRKLVKIASAGSCLAVLLGCATVGSSPIPSRVSLQTVVLSSGQAATPAVVYDPKNPPPVDAPPPEVATVPTSSNVEITQTHFDPDGYATPASLAGITYFLPRQLAKVTAKRSETSLDKPLQKLAEAELALTVADGKVNAAKAAIMDTEDLLVAKGDIPAIRDLLVARLEEQRKTLIALNTAAATKKGERDTARSIVVEASQPGNGGGGTLAKKYVVSLNIELMPPTADPRHGYRLSPRHSLLRDDEHKLTVSAGGLLNTVDIVAADRTADILVELATFAGAISGSATGARTINGKTTTCPTLPPEAIIAVVDLADPKSVLALNATMGCMGARLTVVGESWAGTAPSIKNSKASVQGIVYRTPVEILVQIEKCDKPEVDCDNGGGWFTSQIVALSLPQAGPISYIRQDAGFMTKTKYASVFKDGILTTYDSNRPSEVLEVARTPMRVLNAFFDGASKIISIRTGQNTAQTGLVNGQTTLQQAQYNLLAAQLAGNKQLSDAELALLQSQVALQSGQYGGQSQLSAAQLSAMLALRRDQAKTDAVNRCIGEKVTKGEPFDACLTLP